MRNGLSADASIVSWSVNKAEVRIIGNDLHPSLSQTDSHSGATIASAYLADSYGTTSTSWSISPLTANEAQINMNISMQVYGSNYNLSSFAQSGEVHINYHSDTAFTVNYYWDLPYSDNQNYVEEFWAQKVKLRIYDSQNNSADFWLPSVYPYSPGHYTGSPSFNYGAGDWLFIVFTSGSYSRYGGDSASLLGNVYLDFDYGERAAVALPPSLWIMASGLIGLIGVRRKIRK